MAELFSEDFEGGTAGAAVTAANTAFSIVSADVTFSSEAGLAAGGGGFGEQPFGTSPFGGGAGTSLTAQIAPATSQARDLRVNYTTPQSLLFRRWYMKIPAAPSAVFTFAQLRGGGATRGSLRMQPGGQLVVFNGATNILVAPASTIPVDTWVRVEWRIDLAVNQQQVRLFHGANLHGTTPTYDTGNRAYTSGSVDQSILGIVTALQTVVLLDSVKDDSATWVGPATGTGGTGTGPVALGVSSTGAGTSTVALASVSSALSVSSTGSGSSSVSLYGIPVPPPSILRQFHEWVCFARGVDFAPLVPLPIISAQLVVKHMGVGAAVIRTAYTAERWEALQPGNGITVWRDGRQEFTGLMDYRTVTWDSDDGRAVLEIGAVGDEIHLAKRLSFPDPDRAANDQTASDYWRYTGRASSAMLRLIADQAGATARADRRVTGLVLGTDPGVGISRTWSALFTPVLEQLAAMSVQSGGNLGIRITTAPDEMRVDVVAPRNLAGSAVFSADLNNLAGFTYTESAPKTTHAVAAGAGNLKARMRRLAQTVDSTTLQWRRQHWEYIDRSDTTDPAELVAAAGDAIAEGVPTVSLAANLTDSDAATYGTDWGLGDRITVYVGLPGQTKPATVTDIVREISFEVDSNGAEKVRPAIGTQDASSNPPSPVQRQLARIAQTLTGLVTNK